MVGLQDTPFAASGTCQSVRTLKTRPCRDRLQREQSARSARWPPWSGPCSPQSLGNLGRYFRLLVFGQARWSVHVHARLSIFPLSAWHFPRCPSCQRRKSSPVPKCSRFASSGRRARRPPSSRGHLGDLVVRPTILGREPIVRGDLMPPERGRFVVFFSSFAVCGRLAELEQLPNVHQSADFLRMLVEQFLGLFEAHGLPFGEQPPDELRDQFLWAKMPPDSASLRKSIPLAYS